MVASQLIRLQQSSAEAWVFWDYAGRIGGLAVIAAIPAARAVAFQRNPLKIAWWEAALWVAGLVAADRYLGGWLRESINAAIPGTVLGKYPPTQGWLHTVDTVFGLALVAWSEEIVFRSAARHAFRDWLGDGTAMVAITSLVFGLYHWWAGAGNVAEAAMMGVLLMVCYQRAGALWPAVLGHYLVDVVDFF
jgi:membrane protease YdiL (CAAX protease family)